MSVPVWPNELPLPKRSGFQRQRQDPRQRRASQRGPIGYRRNGSTVGANVSMVIEVPRDGLASFDQFYDDVTASGILPFWMPDPTTDGWFLLDEQGQLLQDAADRPLLLGARWLCVFGDTTPIETVRGVRFIIGFTVQVMP